MNLLEYLEGIMPTYAHIAAVFVLEIVLIWTMYIQLSKVKVKKEPIIYSALWFLLINLLNRGLAYLYGDITVLASFLWLPFYYIYSRKHGFSKRLSFFYSAYPSLFLLVFSTLWSFSMFYFFFEWAIRYEFLLMILGVSLSFILNTLILKFFQVDGELLQKNDPYIKRMVLNPLAIMLATILVSFSTFYVIAVRFIETYIVWLPYMAIVTLGMFVVLLSYWNVQLKKYLQRLLQEEKEKHYEDLSRYTKEIENLYQEVRGFRHDFGNLLITLRESIEHGKIEDIQSVYEEVLEKAHVQLNEKSYELVELSQIKNEAVKSLLSSKVLWALDEGLDISVEITDAVENVPIEMPDFIRVFSILLDNAIEAAIVSKEKQVSIALMKELCGLTVIILNSRKNEEIVINQLFKRGFSTKAHDRGTGLATVQEIMNRYDALTLDTTVTETTFRQTIRLEYETSEDIYSRGRVGSSATA
jgi:two-component system sensor histidine kinase AgrC